MVQCGRHYPPCQPHPRTPKRPRRRFVSLSLSADGMGAEPRSLPAAPPTLSRDDSGRVRDQVQHQTSPVCVSRSRPDGPEHGRPVLRLARPGPVCVSSLPAGPEGVTETVTHGVRHDFDRPPTVEPVSSLPPLVSPGRGADPPPLPSGLAAAAGRVLTPPGPPAALSSRLQTELQILQKEEFSVGVLDRLTSDRRPRTLMVYDAMEGLHGVLPTTFAFPARPLHTTVGRILRTLVCPRRSFAPRRSRATAPVSPEYTGYKEVMTPVPTLDSRH